MTFLSAAELERLASQIAEPYGVLVRFLGWTGLRIGEAAALRVGRLDLLGRRVEVVEAATEVNGPTVPTIWCSPCPAAGRCGPPSGASGTSARRWRRPGWLRASASMTSGTPRRPWRSGRTPRSRSCRRRSATQTLDRYGHLYPSDLDALAERLDQAHTAATAAEVWPQGWP
jgi:integrase